MSTLDKSVVRSLEAELPKGFVVRAPRAATSSTERSEIARELYQDGHVPSFRTSFVSSEGDRANARLYTKINGDVCQAKPLNMSVVGYVDDSRSGKGYIIATLYLGQNPTASVYFKKVFMEVKKMLGETVEVENCDQYITVKDGEQQVRWGMEGGEPDKINVLISYKGAAPAKPEEGRTSVLNIKGLVPWGVGLRKDAHGSLHWGIRFSATSISQENASVASSSKKRARKSEE